MASVIGAKGEGSMAKERVVKARLLQIVSVPIRVAIYFADDASLQAPAEGSPASKEEKGDGDYRRAPTHGMGVEPGCSIGFESRR